MERFKTFDSILSDSGSDLSADFTHLCQSGGNQRATMEAKLGPLHRQGGTVFQTFVFKPSEDMRGKARRVAYSGEQIEKMLEGTVPTPTGLYKKLLTKGLQAIETREAKIAATNARFNAMAARADQQGRQDKNVRVHPAEYNNRRRAYVQAFSFPAHLPAPDGAYATPYGAKLICTESDLQKMLRKPATLPEGLTPELVKGRLSVLQRQNHKLRQTRKPQHNR